MGKPNYPRPDLFDQLEILFVFLQPDCPPLVLPLLVTLSALEGIRLVVQEEALVWIDFEGPGPRRLDDAIRTPANGDTSFGIPTPGPNGNVFLLILGFSDAGVINATSAVVDDEMAIRPEHACAKEDLQAIPGFTLLVEAEGINQSVFKSEIRYFAQRHPLPQTAGPGQNESSRSR